MEKDRNMRKMIGNPYWIIGAFIILLLISVSPNYIDNLQAQATEAATSAPTSVGRPSVGNSYPAGPAPTSAPPTDGSTEVTLQVADSLKTGVFAQPHTFNLPSGFTISLYAKTNGNARMMAFSPDGLLFVSEMDGGRVARIRDNNGLGERTTWADGLREPHGLAFFETGGQTYLYVAETNRLVRYKYTPGLEKAGEPEVIVPEIPAGRGHSTRTVVFGKDGKMYLSIGSSCNVCEEADDRRAAVMQFNPDGSEGKIFAAGLRNGVGLAIHPDTGEVWETENSRDNLGDDMPPDEINILKEDAHYGWPYCISNQVFDTNFKTRDQAFCDTTLAPALPLQAHSAPLGMSFYTGTQFPEAYQGDAFVAFHGSWNRSVKTGYKVVRIHVENGRPTKYEDFLTGFLDSNAAWGRPVHPLTGPDGNLYLSDDEAGAVYKITYSAAT
jgi:glucose/arabinose dehydrogenase